MGLQIETTTEISYSYRATLVGGKKIEMQKMREEDAAPKITKLLDVLIPLTQTLGLNTRHAENCGLSTALPICPLAKSLMVDALNC